ncbi:MAG: hypothetical protein ACREAT_00250, partial [Nitrosotalea sp.]
MGDYRAVVSIPQGTAESDFIVVSNPSAYINSTVTSSAPFTIATDKNLYAVGDPITMFGQILNPIQTSTQNSGTSVKIQVLNSTGMTINSAGNAHANISTVSSNQAPTSSSATLSYSVFPSANGRYQIQQIIQEGVYAPGTYTLKASYLNLAASTTFTVYNPLATGSQGPIAASTNKKVYGIGETVQLTGQISSLASTASYTLTLIKPDGEQVSLPLPVTKGVFSWNWVVPSTANSGTLTITDRSASHVSDPTINIYGIYHIKITSGTVNADLFFQVSKNPQPNQDISPLVLMTDKTNYLSTDVAKIWGEVVPTQNAASVDTNTAVQISIYTSDG